MAKSDKENRQQFGIAGVPINATGVLVKDMDSADFNGQTAICTIVLNSHAETMTPANHYNGNLGKNFNAQPRPYPGEDRLKEYAGRGYTAGDVSKFPALQLIDAKTGKPVTAKAPAATA
jgi:hypothetical protein